MVDGGLDLTDIAGQGDKDPQFCDDPKGFDAQAGDPVEGQLEHFAERIVALAANPLMSFVINARTLEADEGNQPSEEEVHFFELCQFFQDS